MSGLDRLLRALDDAQFNDWTGRVEYVAGLLNLLDNGRLTEAQVLNELPLHMDLVRARAVVAAASSATAALAALNGHDIGGPITGLSHTCRICGGRLTLVAMTTNRVKPCPGPPKKLVGAKAQLFFKGQPLGEPKVIEWGDPEQNCKCGSASCGYGRNQPEKHSSYCPWSKR